MKSRSFLATAFAALLLCSLAPAPAHSDDADHGAVVTIVSGGSRWLTADGVWRRFAFTAKEYDDHYVTGEWQLVAGAAIMHGNVTCLTLVDDQNARVGGVIEQAKFTSFLPGTDIAWVVTDAGEGGGNPGELTSSLRAFLNASPGSASNFCTTGALPNAGANLGVDAIDHGNFQILRLR